MAQPPFHPHSSKHKRARQEPSISKGRAPISAVFCAPGEGDLSRLAQVEFAGAELRQCLSAEELVGARLPEVWQVALSRLLQARPQRLRRQLVKQPARELPVQGTLLIHKMALAIMIAPALS